MKRSMRLSGNGPVYMPPRSGLGLAWVLLAAGLAGGEPITWDVDPSASYIRLTVPDQDIDVPDIGDVTVRLRDATSTTQWTDGGGRRASIDGLIATDYVEFTSIVFLGGQHQIHALEQTNLRPNPSDWDSAAVFYTKATTAPAALGARVQATLLLTFDAAFMAMREVRFDLGSGVVPLGPGSTFAGNQSSFGIASALIDVDGLALPLGLGQPIPDLFHEPFAPTLEPNGAGGVIEDVGGHRRRLTYHINVDVAIQLDTTAVTGSADGQIVAYATMPAIPFDFLGDGDVDLDDYAVFGACATGPAVVGLPPGCTPEQFAACDTDDDQDVDHADFGVFQRCYSGTNRPGSAACAG